MPVKRLTISGFRGILAPLTLDFIKGKSKRSMIIYGKNGTGKSSITDAWEWFQYGRIEHLAREGAQESSYPHREAQTGETSVEVEFEDNQIGLVHIDYDFNRIRTPMVRGNHDKFKRLAFHPIHLRHGDLSRFVYSTKAEQYDALSRLMGFARQVEIQKALRKVQRRIDDELKTVKKSHLALVQELFEHLGFDPGMATDLLDAVNVRLVRSSVAQVQNFSEVRSRYDELRIKVENDPFAIELGQIQTAKRLLTQLSLDSQLPNRLSHYREQIVHLLGKETSHIKQLLLRLYEQGESVLLEQIRIGQQIECCPLCGKKFGGNLLEHVQHELTTLKELKQLRDKVEAQKNSILEHLPQQRVLANTISTVTTQCQGIAIDFGLRELTLVVDQIESELANIRELLQKGLETIDDEQHKAIGKSSEFVSTLAERITKLRQQASSIITNRESQLNNDQTRNQLVKDYDWIGRSLELYSKINSSRLKSRNLDKVSKEYAKTIDDYSTASLNDVQTMFTRISDDVRHFFHTLEEGTVGLSNPTLKLLADQDRAVVVEIIFHNRIESPAYKYLSESQLNSFGLSVFLASAKRFNSNFKFLVLDDIVNSFDGYKRPRVIRLLKQEFSDFQLLILTHDNVWWNQLVEHFPSWIRIHFQRIEYGYGPITSHGLSELEFIKQLLDQDHADAAGRMLGPYLERKLQEICESFQAAVPYRPNNEYTLRELVQRLQSRIRDKLTGNHLACRHISALDADVGFRNFCSHWKNPEIPITTSEINGVVTLWDEIFSLVSCSHSGCNSLLRYEDTDEFVCHCRATKLSKKDILVSSN